MPGKKKLPRAAGSPAPQKGLPRIEGVGPRDEGLETPAWQFGIVDCKGYFAWPRADMPWIKNLLLKLAVFESMTWKSIKAAGSHAVSKDMMSRPACERLRDIRQDDIDELYSLRITGKQRVWGIKSGRILKLLWWDPKHEVCPVQKRHT